MLEDARQMDVFRHWPWWNGAAISASGEREALVAEFHQESGLLIRLQGNGKHRYRFREGLLMRGIRKRPVLWKAEKPTHSFMGCAGS
jgi:hypothetical protein